MRIADNNTDIGCFSAFRMFFLFSFLLLTLSPPPAFSNIEDHYLICFQPDDLEGINFIPLMYYFENDRVKSYVLDKQITNKSIIASQREYRVKRKVDERYRLSGKKYIYWQERDLTFLYNKELSVLRTRILDENKDSYKCKSYTSKNGFIRQVKKWRKLQNLREPIRPHGD